MSERSTVIQAADGDRIDFELTRLLVEDGPDTGRELLLVDQPVVVGRGEDADLRLEDPGVSRAHLVIQPAGQGWKLRDLGSKGGTFLDGTRVEVAPLEPGARVRLGATELVLRSRRTELQGERREVGELEGLLGESEPMRRLFGLVERVAELELPVLLRGEAGTGKEGLARALHRLSGLRDGPYEVVDCTLGEGELLRGELFGHVKGAFAGAEEGCPGAFARAHGGTLLLDRVAKLPLELQPAVLRVLEEGEVRPLGGQGPERIRVRVISSTSADLGALVSRGRFRADLYYRLTALTLEVPPLRERGDDVLLLARGFLTEGRRLSEAAERALVAHRWPGNVRELENAVRRACVMAEGEELTPEDLELAKEPGAAPPAAPGRGKLVDYEKEAILHALEVCRGNRRQAAKRLGIARSTLYRKLEELGID